jgi:hypothetical protein
MRKLRFCAIVVGVLFQACASVDSVVVAEPGMAFSLPVGKTAALGGNGGGSRITFRKVTEDSRCPINAVCVWEGDAQIEVTVSRDGAAAETRVLSLSQPNNEARIGDLFVRFVSLAPHPETPEPNRPRAYIAQLVVRRL